jgi:hypothetical protein
MTEFTWHAFPIQRDPLTNREICFNCWHNIHDCKNEKCDCLCKELEANAHEMRLHERAVRKTARAARKEALEESPLKADNPLPERRKKLEEFIAQKFGIAIGEVRKLGLIRLSTLDPETRKQLLTEAVNTARRKQREQRMAADGRKAGS